MVIEEKDGSQSYPKRSSNPEYQRESASSQERNNERKPAYHATRDGSGYQMREDNRLAQGRRPRIKDNRSVNYNRTPYGGEYRPNDNREGGRFNYPPQSSRMDEGRPYQQSARPVHPYGSGERREYPARPNMERGYPKRERIDGNYDNNRPQSPNNRFFGGRPGDNRMQMNRRPQPGGRSMAYNPNAKYSHQKQLKYKEVLSDPNEPIRLNKFLANAGVCSRREADEFIQAGVVRVNGNVITELGTKITRQDTVLFHDRHVQIESKLYILLNKPKNCVTTSDDPNERLTVMDLVKNACRERIYPVGRLDRNTTGVLLLTNDGDLASKLTHPTYKKKKIYHVWIDKDVAIEDMEKLATGIELEDGEIHADAISYANEEDRKQVGIEIHSGRNRIVRRMFEALGYRVIKLDRVYFAGLTKKNLSRGKWRYLNEKEVNMLRMGAFE
ncbi:MAG: rRNA pseudouridine synthase [Tannerella sp.]|jgi:23S rRNA pseudouridine2605 synthase|nr:rRNA pseudouridine synthase [Tannerella sp.]